MQILKVSAAQRAQLLGDSLLAINSQGEEVLHGLTFEESQFLIDCGKKPPSDAAALDRCSDLARKHEQARLRIATADDESSASEASRLRTARF
jgi:hypothetical protein